MSEAYLLDTNAAIALLNGDAKMLIFLEDKNELYLSSVVLGELVFGAHKSQRVQDNLNRIDRIAALYPILECDADTAYEYGRIAYAQRMKGRAIPYHDIWIAALARQHNLILLTQDAHFNEVDGISREGW